LTNGSLHQAKQLPSLQKRTDDKGGGN